LRHIKHSTLIVHFCGWLPLAWLAAGILIDGIERLGANPAETLSHYSGQWAFRFLLATLLMSPIRQLLNWRWPLQVRRALGLYCFAWATAHLLIYWLLDLSLAFTLLFEDLAKRPYILVGTLAWLCLLPLAITSTRGWQRRLRRRWTKLHRLIYPAVILVSVHFFMQPKTFDIEPWIYATIAASLLMLRLPPVNRQLRRLRPGR